jgi:hypothetical protein
MCNKKGAIDAPFFYCPKIAEAEIWPSLLLLD